MNAEDQLNKQLSDLFARHYRQTREVETTEKQILALQNALKGIALGREIEKQNSAPSE